MCYYRLITLFTAIGSVMSADDPNTSLSEDKRLELRMARERALKVGPDGADDTLDVNDNADPTRPIRMRPHLRLVPPSPYSQRNGPPENTTGVQR